MERMEDLEEMLRELSEKYKNSKSVEVYEEDLEGWFKIIDDLREENKSLKANVEFLHQCLDDRDKSIQYAEEENKKLNIKVASLEGEIKGLNYTIDKLKGENQTLELWLDNKEKLNEGYRKEIDNKKLSTIAEETISDLQARIKELKDRIDVLYEFIERNDKLVDEVIAEEDLDKLNRYIYIDDDLVDRTLESED